ncbi:hypothetical protein ACET3Z_011041 [Daucus carota]
MCRHGGEENVAKNCEASCEIPPLALTMFGINDVTIIWISNYIYLASFATCDWVAKPKDICNIYGVCS